jgi:feruloyl esterase
MILVRAMMKAGRQLVTAIVALMALMAVPVDVGAATGDACGSLAEVALSQATVVSAQLVAASGFTPPNGRVSPADGAVFAALPAFCRVEIVGTPAVDSRIGIEVWLPEQNWNGRFQGVGNRGWGGSISYGMLAAAVAGGYASASTDTGHTGSGASFALGHPEKIIDAGDRAVHEMTTQAKVIVDRFYRRPPRAAYWNGCSLGGRQGLAEAQRYPADYDGIVVGDVANDVTHTYTARMSMARDLRRTADSRIPPSKFVLIHRAVLQACDAQDGHADGLIDDPTICAFDPQTIQCAASDSEACLTAGQVSSVRALYSAVIHPETGALISPGLEPGSELGWAAVAGDQPESNALEMFKFAVFGNAQWDWTTAFDLAAAVDRADAVLGATINATSPDLRPFFAKGGRLIMYHGWADPQTPPRNTINYARSVVRIGGDRAMQSIRVFMIPGMGHCEGGDGPDTFDKMTPLVDWVEQGRAPELLEATRQRGNTVDLRRQLRPLPLEPK